MCAYKPEIRSEDDLAKLVSVYGFLPFSRNSIPGFSVEEHTPSAFWFVDGVEGPWEWKGPAIEDTGCAYGKFFHGKSGFISFEWFLDYANWKRDGYDFDARSDEGLVRYKDRLAYEVLQENGSLISRVWRELCGISKRGEFDSIVSRLQAQGYVTTSGFEYSVARDGSQYGWGLARYTTPELLFGEAFTEHVYERSPEESRERIEAHLHALLPSATGRQIKAVIG